MLPAALRAQDNGEFQILNDDGESIRKYFDSVPNERERDLPDKGEREALAEIAGDTSTKSEAIMTGDESVNDAAQPQKVVKPRGSKGEGEKKGTNNTEKNTRLSNSSPGSQLASTG